ncbi:DUF2061 domain-containing protein [Sneathiella chinensis]|uniref:DUF2061 domain-containing protein n=1 Tax=Sneathiella chinensis TaxID=349750 RepID=A0ABQ5U3M0_9PROT|nr:DUF2061 domain-containing protein [Sneathiella chinensis]GLQ06782.1 hypothetical protein GCM10007924_20030 [Sneathiella chinensis]
MRLALKTISYGATHIVVATGVAYLLTGNLMAAIGIGLLEPIVQTAVYSVHEYLWDNPRGRRLEKPEPSVSTGGSVFSGAA